MKKTIYTIAMALMVLLTAASCADDNEKARTPVASATISSQKLAINQTMKIDFTGVADQVVVYTGDKDHNYGLRESGNTGYVVNKGEFTYSYSQPGTFHVVCIASTYDTYMAGGLRQDSTSFDVTVIDDETEITSISSYINPNTYFAEALDDANWVLCLPSKQVYNNKEVSLNAKRQRLTFEIGSTATQIYIDETLYNSRTYYDLTKEHDIKVISNYGTVRNYSLFTLIYPELKTVSANGIVGKLKRDAFYQDKLTYEFTLNNDINPKAVSLNFTLDDNVKLYGDNVEITSGETIDLTDADKVYTLVRTSPDNPKVTATSKVYFNVK